MDHADRGIRNTTYQMLVELGRAPLPAEVAARTGRSVAAVEASWWRLHDAHAVVLQLSGEIRMANPFSAVPTVHRVHTGGRTWFANCAWDAIGICAALHADGDIETECPCCDEAITLSIRATAPSDQSPVFHCLVPAGRWWDDIGYT